MEKTKTIFLLDCRRVGRSAGPAGNLSALTILFQLEPFKEGNDELCKDKTLKRVPYQYCRSGSVEFI